MKLCPIAMAAIATAALFSSTLGAYANVSMACQNEQPTNRYAQDTPIRGVSWNAWRVLLRLDWSVAEKRRPGWFETDALISAAKGAPLSGSYNSEVDQGEYTPPVPGTQEQAEDYAVAQKSYHSGSFAAAVAAFDPIANQVSTYRAAAAYSAARATLDLGDFEGGIHRIGAILADPADSEMHQAAHHLLGTLAAETNAAPLLAARLAEISHLLMAPAAMRCSDLALATLSTEAGDDLAHIISFAYATDERSYGPTWSPQRRSVFAEVGRVDPLIDLVATLSEPANYGENRSWIEPFYPQSVRIPGYSLVDQDVLANYQDEDAAATTHAREQAALGNPLWAYALASRTVDVSDLTVIKAAIATVLSGEDVRKDRQMLAAWLAAQEMRILVMAGREADALANFDTLQSIANENPTVISAIGNFVTDGGIRFLLARRDIEGAKRWAVETDLQRGTVFSRESGLSMELALSWEEALQPGIAHGSMPGRPPPLPESLAAALDLQPADKLVALARTPGLAMSWRRPILGAAWIRYYMLGRDAAFRSLFAEVRAAFPETVADLDEVDRAWTSWTRRRLITRMLLRLPGLSPRVMWVRRQTDGGNRYFAPPIDLFAVDSWNPSDGNWWCPVDPARARRDAFGALFTDLSQDWRYDAASYLTFVPTGVVPTDAPGFDRLATDWLAWYPLTKDADYGELELLSRAASGPVRLAGDAQTWALHSNFLTRWLGFDRYLPETLALAVRSTRWGCRLAEPLGPSSRAAWESLHKLYPRSEWARRTPWWFDVNHKGADGKTEGSR